MRGRKRKSGAIENGAASSEPKKLKSVPLGSTPASEETLNIQGLASAPDSHPPPDNGVERPRLTTPNIEFDYDRDQLRDPRPTPGRKARPRYNERDIPDEVLTRLKATRTIPGPPPKPKGRLTNAVKDEMFKAESRVNPLKTFHNLYVCYEKGPKGSPTYDEAGFQLDYEKVADWFKPRAYNKKRMIDGMERRLKRGESEQEHMFRLFFKDWDKEKANGLTVKDYVKDQISKDLGIPWSVASDWTEGGAVVAG